MKLTKETKLKALDALVVYMGVLIISAVVGNLLYRLIGLPALYISRVLCFALPFVVAHKTRLKSRAWLKFEMPAQKEIFSSAMIFSAVLLLAIPILLFVQIIVPDFAVSCFHITDALEGYSLKILHIILLIALSAISETLIFEGFIYTRMKGFPKAVCAVMIAFGYAIFQLDLYTLLPIFIIELGIIYIRMKSRSLVVPTALHMVLSCLALAVRDYARSTEQLIGTQMGVLQVFGLLLMFSGVSMLPLYAGARLAGDLKGRSAREKAVAILVCLVLSASGYAISRL